MRKIFNALRICAGSAFLIVSITAEHKHDTFNTLLCFAVGIIIIASIETENKYS